MAMSYTKLFSTIIHSTIWQAPDHVRLVWITMLAMSDKDGCVYASVPGLAKAAGVSINECDSALEALKAPDIRSRTQEREGRRIEDIEGGWWLINHRKYRDMLSEADRRERNRIRVARHRDKKRDVTPSITNNAGNDMQKQITEAEAESKAESKSRAREEQSSGQCPKATMLAAALASHKRFRGLVAFDVAEDMVSAMGAAALNLTPQECTAIIAEAAVKAETGATEGRLRAVLSWGCKDLEKNRRRSRSEQQNNAGGASESEHLARKASEAARYEAAERKKHKAWLVERAEPEQAAAAIGGLLESIGGGK